MTAHTIKEMLGVDEATVAISFTNVEKLKYTGVVGMRESDNIVTFIKRDRQNLLINIDNVNYISLIIEGGEQQ